MTALSASAQNHFIGLKGGYNRTGVSGDEGYFRNKGWKSGFSAGLSYEYRFNKRFQFGADVLYQGRGFRSELVFEDNRNLTGNPVAATIHFHYLAVPLKAGIRHGYRAFGFANIGVVPALLATSTLSTAAHEHNGTKLPAKTEPYDLARVFDIGGMIEVGGGYSLSPRCGLTASASYQQTFTPFNTTTYFPAMTHRVINASVGISYALRK